MSVWVLIMMLGNSKGDTATLTQWPTEHMCLNAKAALLEAKASYKGLFGGDETFYFFKDSVAVRCVEVKP